MNIQVGLRRFPALKKYDVLVTTNGKMLAECAVRVRFVTERDGWRFHCLRMVDAMVGGFR